MIRNIEIIEDDVGFCLSVVIVFVWMFIQVVNLFNFLVVFPCSHNMFSLLVG